MKRSSTFTVLPVILFFAGILIIQSCQKELGEQPATSIAGEAVKTTVVLNDMELLGKKLFFDKISNPDMMSCATCHDPDFGFTGPVAGANIQHGIYRGAVATRFGNRKPPSAAYATPSPIFHYDNNDELFIGGNFWDGRATGAHLGNPAADQALGPFLNPVEQNNADKLSVLSQIASSNYAPLWNQVWGALDLAPGKIDMNYDRVGLAIAAYENSAEVNQFSSKYDYYLKDPVAYPLSSEEMRGLQLFNGKGMCNACHPSEGPKPLFTDFSFDNLGVPRNLSNPFYTMDKVIINGNPVNPEGSSWIDPGLGGFLQHSGNPAWAAIAMDNWGKHKVPTLRNVDKRAGTNTPKAYMHNGVFKSLEEVVHFYNTRDVKAWPAPEVSENVNTDELGNLGLTADEEKAIVIFMKTLNDGYVPKKK
jgi:cytochrome c peroxidase